MPQELRHPEFLTERPNYTAIKLLKTRNILSAKSIIERGAVGALLAQMGLDAIWPDRTLDQSELIVSAVLDIDEMYERVYEMYTMKPGEYGPN